MPLAGAESNGSMYERVYPHLVTRHPHATSRGRQLHRDEALGRTTIAGPGGVEKVAQTRYTTDNDRHGPVSDRYPGIGRRSHQGQGQSEAPLILESRVRRGGTVVDSAVRGEVHVDSSIPYRSIRADAGNAATHGCGAEELRSGTTKLQSATAPVGYPRYAREWDRSLPLSRSLIIDDCTLHRETLAAVLAAYGECSPIAAWDLPSLHSALSEVTPEIILINMGTKGDVALLRLVRESCPEARVIVVGLSEEDESQIVACAEAGVAGYHLRTDSFADLLSTMCRVASGESYCSPKVSAILLRRLSALAAQRRTVPRDPDLTAREIQILRLLELGRSNSDIADELCIALHTVKNHVHSVLKKLGVGTRVEAAAYSRSFPFRPENAKD